MRKKILSLTLALVTVLALLPATALAADSDFVIKDGVLIEYKGPGGDVTIPSGVTSIGERAFLECSSLTSVNIPSGVTSIGDSAFVGCYSLTSITLPDGMTWIGSQAFFCCENLTSITIPASMVFIGGVAFDSCDSLTDVYYGGTETQWRAIKIGDLASLDSRAEIQIHYNTSMPNQPQQPAGTKTANPTNDKLEVNGVAANPTVYKIGSSNYFKIRDVAAVLNGTEKQFAVGYSGGKVTVTSGQVYEATGKELAGPPAAAKDAASSNDTIVINGVETDVTVYKIGGSNYFKLRDLGKALNFYVGWEAGRGIYIETDKPYSE